MVQDSNKHHELILTNRNELEVSGVTGIESFDSEEFLLSTEYGYLGIRGQELHLKNLDLEQGIVSIRGQFLDISYLDVNHPRSDKTKSVLGRLFR
ncbi:sporulation protein YabP [Shimazuella alba]|jgi:sporulation protein YabP|uniref:Sporulation protein YabP n=1 Tax=Shimazuella alba TaxID=2690964 RepID=A0A6I4W1C7_9BACL|nr:sporulation protein YabP [Shimazuella alba]MXQ54534.1 sporulation protein YabP [Shimazuella alba]